MRTSAPAECPGHECRANSQSRSPLDERSSSHICTQPRTHAFRRALEAPMSARAVAVTPPALPMIARLAFLRILSGQRPVARLPGLICCGRGGLLRQPGTNRDRANSPIGRRVCTLKQNRSSGSRKPVNSRSIRAFSARRRSAATGALKPARNIFWTLICF